MIGAGDRIKWLRFGRDLQPYIATGTVHYADAQQVIAQPDGLAGFDHMMPCAVVEAA